MHKLRAAHLIILMSVGIFIFTSSASAHSWGNKCEATAPLEGKDTHCYMLASRASSALGSIDEVAVTGALSYDWGESEVFASDEEWVSFSKYPGKWVEARDMTGAGYSCCGVHAFWAAYGPQSQWHIYISPGEQPYDQYTNYLLYDAAQNGVWDVYVGCSPGSETWCQVAEYGGLVGASSNANLSSDVGATASRSSHNAIASAASAGGNLVGEVVARVAAPRRPVEESPQSDREVKLKRYTADGELSTSSAVTNKRGRFSFKVRPGAYRLEVAECGPGGTRNAHVEMNRTTHITIVCGK